MFEAIFAFAEQYTALFLGFITAGIAILSTFLALIEYYRKKAYYDYFMIEEYGREACRSGFHPEYLSVAAILISVFCFLGMIVVPWLLTFLSKVLFSIIFISLITISAYLISKIVYKHYHRTLVGDSRGWKDDLLKTNSEKRALCRMLQWFIVTSIFTLFYFVHDSTNVTSSLVFFLVCFFVCAYAYCKLDYMNTQKMIKDETRAFRYIIHEEGKAFILNTVGTFHYCVRGSVKHNSEGDTVELKINETLVISINDYVVHQVLVDGFERSFSNEK